MRHERRWGRTSKGHRFMAVPAMLTVEEWRQFAAEHAAEAAAKRNLSE